VPNPTLSLPQSALTFRGAVRCSGLNEQEFNGSMFAGTRGEGRPLLGFKLWLDPKQPDRAFEYTAFVPASQETVQQVENEWCPSEQLSPLQHIEQISIKLVGVMDEKYSVWYIAHVQDVGDIGPQHDGMPIGVPDKRIEGIQVTILPYGQTPP
jgi:hypothetical protein